MDCGSHAMIVFRRYVRPSLALGSLMLTTAAYSSAQAEDLSGYSGQSLYKTYCASCHGTDGRGDGPVASSLSVEVPDLTRLRSRHGGVFPVEQVRRIIDGRSVLPPHGTRDMPVWGQAFRAANSSDPQGGHRADELVDLLVKYLRFIQAF